MNKRIKELVKSTELRKSYHQSVEWRQAELEKFAQLIAQECINVGWQAFLNDNGIVPTFPAQAMRQHFDIEVQS